MNGRNILLGKINMMRQIRDYWVYLDEWGTVWKLVKSGYSDIPLYIMKLRVDYSIENFNTN